MRLELLLGADEEDALALQDHAAEQLLGLLDLAEGLLEIDDVDARPLGEDEPAHLRVPAAGLVAEMNAGLEQVLQLRLCHAGATSFHSGGYSSTAFIFAR